MQIPNDFPTVPSGFDECQVTNSRGGPSHTQATWWLLVVTGARPRSCCIRKKNPGWKRCGGQPVLVVERSMESWWKDQKDTFASRIIMVTCPRWHLERSGFDAFCSIFGDLPLWYFFFEGIHRHLQTSSLSQVTLTLTALPALLGPLRPLRLGYMEIDDTRVRSKLDSSNWFRCRGDLFVFRNVWLQIVLPAPAKYDIHAYAQTYHAQREVEGFSSMKQCLNKREQHLQHHTPGVLV